jgi:hypothetical protein
VTAPSEPPEGPPEPVRSPPLDDAALQREAQARKARHFKPDKTRDDLRRATVVRPTVERAGWRPEHGGKAAADLFNHMVAEQRDPSLAARRAEHRARLIKEQRQQADRTASQNSDGLELL